MIRELLLTLLAEILEGGIPLQDNSLSRRERCEIFHSEFGLAAIMPCRMGGLLFLGPLLPHKERRSKRVPRRTRRDFVP